MTGSSPPGWHADPTRRHELRWWDGARWSDQVADQGRVSQDPSLAGPVAALDDRALTLPRLWLERSGRTWVLGRGPRDRPPTSILDEQQQRVASVLRRNEAPGNVDRDDRDRWEVSTVVDPSGRPLLEVGPDDSGGFLRNPVFSVRDGQGRELARPGRFARANERHRLTFTVGASVLAEARWSTRRGIRLEELVVEGPDGAWLASVTESQPPETVGGAVVSWWWFERAPDLAEPLRSVTLAAALQALVHVTL